MLTANIEMAGLESGLMIPQYTAASLVLENKILASPDSIHSLPTSANQEDHNANSLNAARHTYQIIQNVYHILAIELYIACHAINIRFKQDPNMKLGFGVNKIFKKIREHVSFSQHDMQWSKEINILLENIDSIALN